VKYSKILRALAVALILSLLVIAIPAAPALAAEEFDLSPENGEVGDKVSVEGTGFKTDGTRVWIYFSDQEADVGDEIDAEVDVYKLVKKRTPDDTGDLDTYFYVPDEIFYEGDVDDPEDVVSGYYYVYVTYEDNEDIEAVQEFTVRGFELDPVEGTVGTEVEISGIGFDGREDIDYINFDDDEVDIESGDDDTDSSGEFVSTILIPRSTAGEHTITVRDDSRNEASATFTVEPQIAISPTSAVEGDEVVVLGTGFGGEQDITITFDGTSIATDDTDADGSFSASFVLPDVAAATYDVEAEDEDDNTAESVFTVTVSTTVTISPVTTETSPAHVGMNVAVSGTDFKANSPITITDATSGILLTTITSDADGAFQVTFWAAGGAGQHIITASDGTDTLSVSFIMESQAPSAPVPLSPEDGGKAEAQALFDWGDVTDDSGVTYTLQVATRNDFTPAFMILEKTWLMASEYTLTAGEKLESTKKEAPYYWRVKTVDGASNVGEWSTLRSLYVGFAFELAGGILYGIMGVGGLLLLGLGYWMGRRTAYSSF